MSLWKRLSNLRSGLSRTRLPWDGSAGRSAREIKFICGRRIPMRPDERLSKKQIMLERSSLEHGARTDDRRTPQTPRDPSLRPSEPIGEDIGDLSDAVALRDCVFGFFDFRRNRLLGRLTNICKSPKLQIINRVERPALGNRQHLASARHILPHSDERGARLMVHLEPLCVPPCAKGFCARIARFWREVLDGLSPARQADVDFHGALGEPIGERVSDVSDSRTAERARSDCPVFAGLWS
jgi:hypothetical protein